MNESVNFNPKEFFKYVLSEEGSAKIAEAVNKLDGFECLDIVRCDRYAPMWCVDINVKHQDVDFIGIFHPTQGFDERPLISIYFTGEGCDRRGCSMEVDGQRHPSYPALLDDVLVNMGGILATWLGW